VCVRAGLPQFSWDPPAVLGNDWENLTYSVFVTDEATGIPLGPNLVTEDTAAEWSDAWPIPTVPTEFRVSVSAINQFGEGPAAEKTFIWDVLEPPTVDELVWNSDFSQLSGSSRHQVDSVRGTLQVSGGFYDANPISQEVECVVEAPAFLGDKYPFTCSFNSQTPPWPVSPLFGSSSVSGSVRATNQAGEVTGTPPSHSEPGVPPGSIDDIDVLLP
jgi:hypothetical protein